MAEIQSLHGSAERRKACGTVISPDLMKKAAAHIARAINNLHSVDMHAAEIMHAAVANANFDANIAEMTSYAIDVQLNKCLDTQADLEVPGKGQSLLEPETWMEKHLWGLLNGNKSFDAKLQGIADHVSKCGVARPSEKTTGIWLSLCVSLHFKTLPSYSALFGHLTDLKDMITAKENTWPFPLVHIYPKSPALLPKHQYDHIFSADYELVNVTAPKMREISIHHMPLRSNHKLLKQSHQQHALELMGDNVQSKQCSGSTTPKRSHSFHGTPVKSELSDSLGSSMSPTPTAHACAHDSPPTWASELMDALKGRPTDERWPSPPAEAMDALLGGPAWASELYNLLGGNKEQQPAQPAQEPKLQRPSQAGVDNLKQRLRPKAALSLRIQAAPAEAHIPAALPAIVDEQPSAGVSIAEYEKTATAALKSVKAKREAAATERKKAAAAEAAARKGAVAAKQSKSTKQSNPVRRRITGKQPVIQKPSGCNPKVQGTAAKRPQTGAMKRPASATEYTPEFPPACPDPDDKAAIEYNGGRMYNRPDKLRVIRNKSDGYTENSFSYKKWGRPEAFEAGLKAIDKYWADQKALLATVENNSDVS